VLAGLSSQALNHLTITLQVIVKSSPRLIITFIIVYKVLSMLAYLIVYAHRINVLNVSQRSKINIVVVCCMLYAIYASSFKLCKLSYMIAVECLFH